ncbi:GPN-loop GTPase QQT1 isoform X2 [Capsicum annuum]|uniref:GPN-loop GTPase QQT1 isoform X2 n=1 Tax=Capsicum annuum TaxID=4072 RepID=UPI001FB14A08|nr:GPN-loop GTPase QQT1 isoform X2 [Capsicum annuum]
MQDKVAYNTPLWWGPSPDTAHSGSFSALSCPFTVICHELGVYRKQPLYFICGSEHYLLFDFPGQVELFFLHENAKNMIMELIKKLDLRLTAVHLVDAHLCSDPGKYVSALLLSLSTMLHLELPHVNVLSKIDLIESYGKLAFNLDFYTDVQDLSYLQNALSQDPRSAKYRKLTKELCEVIEDYGLVNFTTLDIQDKESVGNLVKLIDKSNGYIFAGIDASAVGFSKIAVGPVDWDYYRVAAVQEKYIKDDEDFDMTRNSDTK